MIEPYPLHWPINRPRIIDTESARTTVSLAVARDHLLKQLAQINTGELLIISSNAVLRKDGLPAGKQPKVSDAGVAVWFYSMIPMGWICISCDLYDTIAGNMRAIGLSLAEMRAFTTRLNIDLHSLLVGLFGVDAPQARTQQPPPRQEPPPKAKPQRDPDDWRSILEMDRILTWDQVVNNYRRLAKKCHPDKPGGTKEAFQRLQAAYDQAKTHFKFKE